MAVMAAAMTANAKLVLDNPTPWGDGILVDGVYNFSGSWQGAGTYLGTDAGWFDASQYDLCVIKFSGHTGGAVALGVQYNKYEKTESWGDVYTTESANIQTEAGYVYVKLNKTSVSDNNKKFFEEIRQVQIQDQGKAATLVVEELSFMTQAEYDAETYDPSEPKMEWVNVIVNSDCEGEANDNYVSKENYGDASGQLVGSNIVDGAGVNGSRGIVVKSAAGASQDYDAQFWILLPEAVPAGTKMQVKYDYKASKNISIDTQAHVAPGDYIHWQMCGTANFTTEWQTLEWEGVTVDAQNGMQSIAFNLSKDKTEDVTFYFDNIQVLFEQEVAADPVVENCSAKIDYSSQWATVKLSTQLPFTFDDYVAYRVVLDDIQGEPDGNGVYFNILCESVETHEQEVSWSSTPIQQSDCIFYDNVRTTSGTFEGELKDRMAAQGCTKGINNFALQYTNTQTMSVIVKAVYLQTPAGEWVRQSIDPNVDSWTNTVVTILDDQVGIDEVVAAPVAAVTYNLMGQKSNATKGLIIRNGKLVMMK